jgi:hypothetical protein
MSTLLENTREEFSGNRERSPSKEKKKGRHALAPAAPEVPKSLD